MMYLPIFVLMLAHSFAPAMAIGCECEDIDPKTIAAKEFAKAAVVVTGTVERLRIWYDHRPVEVTILVTKRWKGPSQSSLEVSTASLGHGDCGMPFILGGEFLVVAYPPGQSNCRSHGSSRIPETCMCGLTGLVRYPWESAGWTSEFQSLLALFPTPSEPSEAQPMPANGSGFPTAGAMPSSDVGSAILHTVMDDRELGRYHAYWCHSEGRPSGILENKFTKGVHLGKLLFFNSVVAVESLDQIGAVDSAFEVEDLKVSGTTAGVRFRYHVRNKSGPSVALRRPQALQGEAVLEKGKDGWRLVVMTLSLPQNRPRAGQWGQMGTDLDNFIRQSAINMARPVRDHLPPSSSSLTRHSRNQSGALPRTPAGARPPAPAQPRCARLRNGLTRFRENGARAMIGGTVSRQEVDLWHPRCCRVTVRRWPP